MSFEGLINSTAKTRRGHGFFLNLCVSFCCNKSSNEQLIKLIYIKLFFVLTMRLNFSSLQEMVGNMSTSRFGCFNILFITLISEYFLFVYAKDRQKICISNKKLDINVLLIICYLNFDFTN